MAEIELVDGDVDDEFVVPEVLALIESEEEMSIEDRKDTEDEIADGDTLVFTDVAVVDDTETEAVSEDAACGKLVVDDTADELLVLVEASVWADELIELLPSRLKLV